MSLEGRPRGRVVEVQRGGRRDAERHESLLHRRREGRRLGAPRSPPSKPTLVHHPMLLPNSTNDNDNCNGTSQPSHLERTLGVFCQDRKIRILAPLRSWLRWPSSRDRSPPTPRPPPRLVSSRSALSLPYVCSPTSLTPPPSCQLMAHCLGGISFFGFKDFRSADPVLRQRFPTPFR